MKVVEVEMSGGLGNQLFKWANGLRIAKAKSAKLLLNIDFYKNFEIKPQTTPREFQLHKLPLVAKTFQVSPFVSLSRSFKFLRIPLKENYSAPDGKVLNLFDQVFTVRGNFEDLKYIPPDVNVRNAIDEIESVTPWLAEKIDFFDEKRVLAVHIRLGDYLNNADLYDVVSQEYYINAIKCLSSLTTFDKVLLFSDDPSAASDRYPKISREFEFLASPRNADPIETLKLLTCAKGIVSTNSTFSWWATYFHKHRELTIIPEKYSNIHGDKSASKLRLPNQIVLKN